VWGFAQTYSPLSRASSFWFGVRFEGALDRGWGAGIGFWVGGFGCRVWGSGFRV